MDKTPLQLIADAFNPRPLFLYYWMFGANPDEKPPETRCPLPYLWQTHTPYKNTVDTRFFREV
jgi:hypothetical protein